MLALYLQEVKFLVSLSDVKTNNQNKASLKLFYYIDYLQYVQQAANAGYEIPARLRTLHNLVIQYASQVQYLKTVSS